MLRHVAPPPMTSSSASRDGPNSDVGMMLDGEGEGEGWGLGLRVTVTIVLQIETKMVVEDSLQYL